jgi:hypothetical protein
MAMQWMRFPHHIEERQHHVRLEGQCSHLVSGHGLHEFQQEGHLSSRAATATEPPQVRYSVAADAPYIREAMGKRDTLYMLQGEVEFDRLTLAVAKYYW